MKINAISMETAESVIILVGSDLASSTELAQLGISPERLLEQGFKGKSGDALQLPVITQGRAIICSLIGMGDQTALEIEGIVAAIASAVGTAKNNKLTQVNLMLDSFISAANPTELGRLLEGVLLSTYRFDRYKAPKEDAPKEVELSAVVAKEHVLVVETAMKRAKIVSESVNIARDLVNEPANVIYPQTLADEAVKLGQQYGFEVEVKDLEEIKALKMEAFLSVAHGSEKTPKLIVMRHMKKPSDARVLGLVGKGLTYDSGGYAIKPADGMLTMKSDMGGAAAVIGTMAALSRLNVEANVIAVVAACENMISGDALKNGDIIGSMAGKTIEIINTDAEGRLTLADAVHYIIEKEKATHVTDIATLTGGALVALGLTTAPVISNNDEFFKLYETAAKRTGEKVWRLPSDADFKKLNNSHIADLKNSGGRFGGTIAAGLFIGEFVQEKPWIHIDIAGTSWTDFETATQRKGATGFGVKSLLGLTEDFWA